MGRSITPKYRVEMFRRNPFTGDRVSDVECWKGRASDTLLESYVLRLERSYKPGEVNGHISASFGYLPAYDAARIVDQKTGQVVATWKSAPFRVME
jgi:hypothetical protein